MKNGKPTGKQLREWLKRRKLTRAKAALLCGVSDRQFDRYCLPRNSNGATPMPTLRWEALKRTERRTRPWR